MTDTWQFRAALFGAGVVVLVIVMASAILKMWAEAHGIIGKVMVVGMGVVTLGVCILFPTLLALAWREL